MSPAGERRWHHRVRLRDLRGLGWRRSSQRLVQPMQQPRPRFERRNVDLLVMGMRTLSIDTEAVEGCNALDGSRQIAIAVRDQCRELVDLIGRFRRGLDFDPAADALKDDFRIEGIGCRQHAWPCRPPTAMTLRRMKAYSRFR